MSPSLTEHLLEQIPDRVLPGGPEFSIGTLSERLRDLEKQSVLLEVVDWYTARPELSSLRVNFVMGMDEGRVYLVEDSLVHAGGAEYEAQLLPQVEKLIELMDEALDGGNSSMVDRLIRAMNQHHWDPSRYQETLGREAERLLPGEGEAWLGSFVAHAKAAALDETTPTPGAGRQRRRL